jgi:TRAP transporter TAXI family solute receptor
MKINGRFLRFREVMVVALPAGVLVIAAFWFTLQFVQPAPPTKIVIGTSRSTNPYYKLAERYKKFLARHKITLEVRETAASSENLKLLKDPASGVEAGFVQGGVTPADMRPGLKSLGRVIYEPVWIFHQASEKIERLTDLKGKRVLIGPKGSGTSVLAERLLAANDVTPQTATLINRELPDYPALFDKGEVDAGFLVVGASAPVIQKLLESPSARLLNLSRATAYTKRFPYLMRLDLEQGVVNFAKNIPPADTAMVAATAGVIVRDNLHPALANLLTQALVSVHSEPVLNAKGEAPIFQRAGEFPMSSDAEFGMSEDARQVYRQGAPFLQRFLPFWLATTVDRLFVMALPVIGVLLPVLQLAPTLYTWRVRQRILHWYKELKEVETGLNSKSDPRRLALKQARVEEIEEAVNEIPVPLDFSNQLYDLREHIDVVRRRLAAIKAAI